MRLLAIYEFLIFLNKNNQFSKDMTDLFTDGSNEMKRYDNIKNKHIKRVILLSLYNFEICGNLI